MNQTNYPPDYFEHNGFKEIDETLLRGGHALAIETYQKASFKMTKKNCVLIFKQNDTLYAHIKRDYASSLRQSKLLIQDRINSIIYIFTDYPKIVKHHIITENLAEVTEYETKTRTSIISTRIDEPSQ